MNSNFLVLMLSALAFSNFAIAGATTTFSCDKYSFEFYHGGSCTFKATTAGWSTLIYPNHSVTLEDYFKTEQNCENLPRAFEVRYATSDPNQDDLTFNFKSNARRGKEYGPATLTISYENSEGEAVT